MFGLDLHGWEQVMVASLLLAGIIAVVIGISTFLVVKLQRLETKAAAEEFAIYRTESSKDIANANARAAEANLELEQYKAPRTLSQEEQDLIVIQLSKFKGQEFTIITYRGSEETLNFSNQVLSTLSKSGWKFIKDNNGFPFPGVVGIQIYIHPKSNQSTKNAASSLAIIMKECSVNTTPLNQDEDAPITNQISLIVGTKQ